MREFHSLTETQRKEHIAKFGKYNDFPPNWKPCEPSEFWGTFMTYSADVYEFRQMFYPQEHIDAYPPNHYGQRTMRNAKLFFYNDGTGIAMVQNYDYNKMEDATPLLYQFAVCEHEMVEVPEKSYMCYHVSKCSKCGHERAVDSSG